MRLDNSKINEIKNSVDIVDIISSYIPLTNKGKNYFGVCPFHDDHSPSMSVSREKQIYTCFSCGATGNVFKFVEDYENISFIEALKKIANQGGINVEIDTNYKKINKYQDLYDIYSLSQKFYTNNINSKEGMSARDYLSKRSIDSGIIKEFGIGLSLNKKDMLTTILKKKSYSDETLIKSGLINENNLELNDVYRNRIMFPLYDLSGKIVGYNGRIYNKESENKYINCKETPIFKKGELLYNYHRAKEAVRVEKRVIVVEGQLDTIRLYTIGIKSVVATLGTAFTKEHAMLLRKLSSNIILCFDGDAAGLKATKSAIEELTKVGIEPKIVRLSDNLDPDEYILKKGELAYKDNIKSAMNIMEFKEKSLKSEYDLNDTRELSLYVNDMIESINKIDDDILKEISINKLSKDAQISVDFIKSKLTKNKPVVVKQKNIHMDKYMKSEAYILYYMLMSKDVIKMYEKKITRMPTLKYRQLAFMIDCFYKENGYIDVADLITYLSNNDEMINTLGEINRLDIDDKIDYDMLNDYFENIRKYNEKKTVNMYKEKMNQTADYKEKLEYAKKAIEIKKRSEEDVR